MDRRYVYVVDDFYEDPEGVREKALSMQYRAPRSLGLGGMRTPAFRPRGVRARIERLLRVRIASWETAGNSANGAFFCALSRGRDAERVCVHYDLPVNWMTMLIYLTPGAPLEAGTSLWQHKETGLCACPTPRDAERLGLSPAKLAAMLEKDGPRTSRWREIDRVGNALGQPAFWEHDRARENLSFLPLRGGWASRQ